MGKKIIKNNRLSVEISQPGESYSGSRFDWTGFITQITLDGKVTFCVPEKFEKGKGSGGIGFCNEFGIDQPIGYQESTLGEEFPKIGVGMLKKEKEEPYDFFYPYKIRNAEVKFKVSRDHCQFTSTLIDANGYESILEKVISIDENQLIIAYHLKNVGVKHLKTNEYGHNFIGMNSSKLGEGYALTIPNLKSYDLVVGEVVVDGNQLTWIDSPKEEFYMSIETSCRDDSFNWQLYNYKIGAGVREISKIAYDKFAIWGYTHVVCPELFISIDLEPGESMSWKREYEFYNS